MRNFLHELTDERKRTASMNWVNTPLPRKTYDELKVKLHRRLIDALDLNKLSTLEGARIESDVRPTLEAMVMAEPGALSHLDRQRLVVEIENEVFGLVRWKR